MKDKSAIVFLTQWKVHSAHVYCAALWSVRASMANADTRNIVKQHPYTRIYFEVLKYVMKYIKINLKKLVAKIANTIDDCLLHYTTLYYVKLVDFLRLQNRDYVITILIET